MLKDPWTYKGKRQLYIILCICIIIFLLFLSNIFTMNEYYDKNKEKIGWLHFGFRWGLETAMASGILLGFIIFAIPGNPDFIDCGGDTLKIKLA